ncbi:hypothetical protein ACQP2K_21925 [Microbispora siamensis]
MAVAAVEHTVLRAVEGRLPTPTPRILEAGRLDGWSYILMTRLRGESLALAWPRIPRDDRREHLRVVRDGDGWRLSGLFDE